MVPAPIRPGTRRILATAAAFLILAAAGAEMTRGPLSQYVCPDAADPNKAQKVTLELDYLEGTQAIVERTAPVKCRIERAVAPLNLNLSVLTNKETYTPRDPKDCLTQAEADSLVCGTLNADSEWTVHGVVIPNPGVYEISTTTGELVCPGGRLGEIWLLPPCGSTTSTTSKTWVSGDRKHFLAFWQPDNGDPSYRDNQAFITNVHEFGHVLNMHHCEFNYDSLDTWGLFASRGYCSDHVNEKGKYPKHVMPGTAANPGYAFCDYNKPHWKMHGTASCCETERLDEPGSSVPISEELKELHEKLVLTVEAEKTRYFPGEPIHVNITLQPRPGVTDVSNYRCLAPKTGKPPDAADALDPALGHLFLSVNAGRLPASSGRLAADFETLGQTFLHEPKESIPVAIDPNGIRRAGVGIWFTLSDSIHKPVLKSFQVKAEFAGFSNDALHLASAPAEIVVNTTNTTPGLYDGQAFELFMHPAARQFLYLLGGDHLPSGLRDLSRISTSFEKTIYAPYADIALGVHWSRPFKGLAAGGALITRAANPAEARRHLLKAKAWNDGHAGDKSTELPPSWKAILETTLSQVQAAPVSRQP